MIDRTVSSENNSACHPRRIAVILFEQDASDPIQDAIDDIVSSVGDIDIRIAVVASPDKLSAASAFANRFPIFPITASPQPASEAVLDALFQTLTLWEDSDAVVLLPADCRIPARFLMNVAEACWGMESDEALICSVIPQYFRQMGVPSKPTAPNDCFDGVFDLRSYLTSAVAFTLSDLLPFVRRADLEGIKRFLAGLYPRPTRKLRVRRVLRADVPAELVSGLPVQTVHVPSDASIRSDAVMAVFLIDQCQWYLASNSLSPVTSDEEKNLDGIDFVVIASTQALQIAEHYGLLPGILWNGQNSFVLNSTLDFVCVSLECTGGANDYQVKQEAVDAGPSPYGHIALIHLRTRNVREDLPAIWKRVCAGAGRGRHLMLACRGKLAFNLPPNALRESYPRAIAALNSWHSCPATTQMRSAADAWAMPVRTQDAQHIGFVLPLGSFGGVERVMENYAREAKAWGWVCHLVVTAGTAVMLLPEFVGVFDSVTIVQDHICYQGSAYYMRGTPVIPRVRDVDYARISGMFFHIDAVVQSNCWNMHPLMGALRARGIATAVVLHSIGKDPMGMPQGAPQIVAQYLNNYDVIAVISQHLVAWCEAMGFPKSKVCYVRNAPSYAIARTQVEDILSKKRQWHADSKTLNVLYMGRIDREKGIDRLVHVIDRTTRASADIRWRFVGDSVLEESKKISLGSQVIVEGHVHSAEELTERYAWADVLIMASRFEGVPLAILEATRVGCVVCATAVGAIPEIISHGKNGLLVDPTGTEEKVCNDLFCAILRLANDRGELSKMSNAAASSAQNEWWTSTTAGFYQALARNMNGAQA